MIAGALLASVMTIYLPCADYIDMVKMLNTTHGEYRVARGIIGAHIGVLELYLSLKGSWTLVVVSAHGQACLAFGGKGWQTEVGGQPL